MGYCRAVVVGRPGDRGRHGPPVARRHRRPRPRRPGPPLLRDHRRRALAEAGSSLADVVRTRVYLVDAGDFDAIAGVHGEVFGDIRPVNTTVVVAALLNPAWKLEVEVEAINGSASPVVAES